MENDVETNGQCVNQAEQGQAPARGAGDGQATEDLAAQLAQAQAQAAEYLDNWRRALADMSNARKRMQREQAELQATASARVLTRLLPVMDDMDRAFEALPPEQANQEWVSGFRLIQRKLQNILESEGATPIATEGQKFDPELHHAVSHEEQPGLIEGDIISEVGRGYKLGEKVLRPALVRVAKGQ
jgi:molecular chaperone GrpE